ncbi:MAG: 30S ribosomal protein S17 [Cyanobacteria bacterium TGS_CYA1]|nr:30S ribosomal protein S17 [Cyanobacteria bacterium TGS_CYA1]MDX2106629.1 30S ribosomal protein S17 [Candidatus Melainabacteria bacterium]
MPKKVLVGTVVSDKMDKTVVVAVERRVAHRRYEKQIVKTTKFKAHDASNACKAGDEVKIEECRPLSKEKTWKVIEIQKVAEDNVLAATAAKTKESK